MIEQFKKDVDLGLSKDPKHLNSKYFYDDIGDKLFIQIMHAPEYYLTRSEFEIFEEQTQEIINAFGIDKSTYFELIELGAGDGTKTKELLKVLNKESYSFDYMPIDISKDVLNVLEQSLKLELPEINVKTKQGDYFEVLESLKSTNHPKVVLFLGSNLGNLSDERAAEFIYKLGSNLHPNDKLLLGVDLIKSASVVLPAYNDKAGVTREFNLNLLRRMNRELGANFNLEQFEHTPEYTEEEGIAKSFLTSQVEQKVSIASIGKTYHFKAGEKIHTEISRKYSDQVVSHIFNDTDFKQVKKLTDSKGYFADYIFTRL